MKTPKITIITPSYNQGQFIEQTIDSVLSQNYPNLEYMIFDGGSSDNSIEIIKKYEKHLSYWESQKDRGQSHAINKGLEKATGDVINWLNSDDFYEKDTLKKIGKYFENSKINVLAGRGNVVKEGGILYQSQGTDLYENNLAKTLGWARIDQAETFFSRKTVEKMGLLNENLHYLMDKEWWMRYLVLFGLENILKIEDIFVNFRLHNNSKTISQEKSFEEENDLIQASLAKKFAQEKVLKALTQIASIETNAFLALEKFPEMDENLLEKVLQYYLLLRAEQFYVKLDFKTSKFLLNKIDSILLDKSSQKQVQKLKFRTKIPKKLIQIFRK